MLLEQSVQGSEGSFVFRPIRQKADSGVPVLLRMHKVIVSGILLPSSPKQKRDEGHLVTGYLLELISI